jgi:predicted RNase H-like nuclease (RuvC/YqgF family)
MEHLNGNSAFLIGTAIAFLAGLTLGWALWSKYKDALVEKDKNIQNILHNMGNIEKDNVQKISLVNEMEAEVDAARTKVRELERQIENNLISDEEIRQEVKIEVLQKEIEKWKEIAAKAQATATSANFATQALLRPRI